MIVVLLLMVASLILVFLGLVTDVTIRIQGTSPFVHMVLTYAGLLVTLLAHTVAFAYIIGLRNLLFSREQGTDEEQETYSEEP